MRETQPHQEPELGFLRLYQIVGDRKRGITPLIPVSASTWWAGVRDGRFPSPIKISSNVTVWRRGQVLDLIARLSAGR